MYQTQPERIYPEGLFAQNPEVSLPKRWEFLKVETILKRHPKWSKDKIPVMLSAEMVVDFIVGVLSDLGVADRERVYAVFLDQNNGVEGIYELSVGTTSESLIGPKEMFRAAILANATGLIVVHNHPSGSMVPSEADKTVTRRLVEAGNFLAVRVLDHIIIGPDKTFFSFQEHGLMTFMKGA